MKKKSLFVLIALLFISGLLFNYLFHIQLNYDGESSAFSGFIFPVSLLILSAIAFFSRNDNQQIDLKKLIYPPLVIIAYFALLLVTTNGFFGYIGNFKLFEMMLIFILPTVIMLVFTLTLFVINYKKKNSRVFYIIYYAMALIYWIYASIIYFIPLHPFWQ